MEGPTLNEVKQKIKQYGGLERAYDKCSPGFYCEVDNRCAEYPRRGNVRHWCRVRTVRVLQPFDEANILPNYICADHFEWFRRTMNARPGRPGDVTRREWCEALTSLATSLRYWQDEHPKDGLVEFVRENRAAIDRIILRDSPHIDRWEVA